MKNFKIKVILKKRLRGIFFKVLLSKINGVFGVFKVITAVNQPFWRHFRTFWAAWKAYLISLTPSTITLWPGTPPANSRHTKQFLSRPHGL
jgi:hypothetical protein